MRFLAIAFLFLSLQTQVAISQEFLEVHSADLKDSNLLKIQSAAENLIANHKLSTHPNSCGEVMTFRGPTDVMNPKNLRLWIHGIGAEMAALGQDEDMKLNPVKLNYYEISDKVTLLADRNRQLVDKYGVVQLSTMMTRETQRNSKDYYILFGDYLDGKTGWMTALVLVKISSGEAVLFANSNDCF